MKNFNWQIVVVAIVVSALTSFVSSFAAGAWHAPQKETTIPNVFTAGQVASADDVNENFETLATAIDDVASDNRHAWAWVRDTGEIVSQGGTSTVTITKVDTGMYCVQTEPNIIGNYGPILATLQGDTLRPGYINANNGWGSACNPYGGVAIYTANSSGTATDRSFVVVIP